MEKLHRLDRRQEHRELPFEATPEMAPPAGERDAAARMSAVQISEFSAPVVQRAPLPGEQTSAPNLDVGERAKREAGSGRPVDAGLRGEVEGAVGYDLSGVRVHDDAKAQSAAAGAGARAFAYGSDIFLGRGESASDKRLMAHEMTHVVQQGHAGRASAQFWREGEHGSTAAEGEADRVAGAVTDSSADKKKPDIAATEGAIGEHIAEGMNHVNTAGGENAGLHYAHNYKHYYPKKWKEDWWSGYADPEFFERVGFMDWVLKPGKSASAGLKKWLSGLTICECNSSVVALHIDAFRAAIGDDKFDDRHGKPGKDIAKHQRLRIKPGTQGTPVGGLMIQTDANENGEEGSISNRPAKKGEWYYFYNHPKYLLKHPGGAWQGENALCMGDVGGVQKWSGMGASNVTEDEMMDQMVRAYNAPRTPRDEEILSSIKERNGGSLPKEYDPTSGEFEDSITKEKILSDPAYTIGSTTRKGGFLVSAGIRLDDKAVKKIRDQ
jgi:hypothetical protein